MAEGRLERWSPLAGIAFVVLFLVGSILMDTSPDAGASDATITDFYEDDGNQLVLESAALVLVAAGVFFVWFVGDLAGRVRASTAGSDLLSRVVVNLVTEGIVIRLPASNHRGTTVFGTRRPGSGPTARGTIEPARGTKCSSNSPRAASTLNLEEG